MTQLMTLKLKRASEYAISAQQAIIILCPGCALFHREGETIVLSHKANRCSCHLHRLH